MNGKTGFADGIRCDEDGNVWAGMGWVGDGYDGVHVFSPDGTRIGMIRMPEIISNITFGGSYRDVRPGGWDPQEHVKDMEIDGVSGGVLYPSNGLFFFRIPDSALLSAIFRAYNDWLAEFCRAYPGQLKGIAMVNVDDPSAGVKELQRAAKLGLVGAMIAVSPYCRMRTSSAEYRVGGSEGSGPAFRPARISALSVRTPTERV